MSSADSHPVAAGELLDLHIEAARQQFDAAAIEHSARKLREKLSLAPRSRLAAFRWPFLVGAASILFVAISLISFFSPGSDGNALAQAQQWFTSFRTLQLKTAVLAGDTATNALLVWFDESGDTRIESQGTITIVKPREGMIYVLLPDGQNIAQRITSESVVGNSMEFLDVVRKFQGTGDRLAESRVMEGVSAVGYRLASDGWTIVLWVDPADGRPLLVEQEGPDGVAMRSALEFNVPLPANAFDVPDGVQLLDQE
jgi:hypothetical protein